ncbi:TonB-dependent receptor plug domain-containing protein [Sphingobium olei]|uniref:TonB-dependent receptor plug domain-containing protein n=1 Tax=Sphingobium olei TaxID=420955 RepID=A0ABW3P052_9SPHN|nr:TonB-dependent receptor [Sphingobium sp.]
MKNISRSALLRASVAPVILGVMLPAAAIAQEQPAAENAETIVVTGSRIATPNQISAAPVTTLSAENIRESGYSKIEDLANTLPQVFAGQSSGVSNGADGTATIDLRGLGPSRTVVLIDGRRLMPGNIGGGAGADLNFIPGALVQAVDLLTGGASSTYGADAVAGVVNFKMNRGFRGIRLDGQYSLYSHKNDDEDIQAVVNRKYRAPAGNTNTGGAYDATLAFGVGFDDDRGSIVGYAGYRHDSAITQAGYDYSVCTLNPDAANNYFDCGGSGTPARPRIGGISAANAALAGIPTASSYTLTDNGTLTPYSSLRDAYNFGPVNYFRRPSDRYTAGLFAEYEIDEHFKPYMDFMFMDYSTKAQIAAAGAFYGPRTVNCDNPFLQGTQTGRAICGAALGTNATADFLLGKRNIEGGPRFNDIGFNQFRIVTGLRGDISDAWNYDAYVQFGQIKVANTYRNDTSNTKIDNALNVVNVGGVATCQSVVDGTDPSCVPYNVFTPNGVTPAAAAYIGIPLVLTGTTKETIVNGSVVGDLGMYGFKSPFAEDGVKIVLGAEYRKEQLATQPDQAYINGDGAGQGGPTLPIEGQYTVKDLFTEANIPLVMDRPFFDALALTLGYRHSSYNVQGATSQNKADTFKIEGTWSPIRDIKFRGSFNRAVRSPNISELFFNQQVGLFSGSDPCAGAAPSATAAQCALTGVTAAQYGNIDVNSAAQYNQLSGGNLNLRPEKANTWTAGVILQPSFVPGLLFSVDYFNIKVKDAVGTIGSQVILNQCIQSGDPFFCSKINRSPASAGAAAGSLWLDESGFVNNQTTNTGSLKTSGFDLNGNYSTSIGNNKLRWQFVGTVLDKYIAQPITGGFSYDCAGFYGITCGNPSPKFRFQTNLKWTFANDIALTARWRHLSKVKVDTISSDPDLASPGAAPTVDEVLKAQNYIDLQASLPLKDTITLRLGMNNVFDKNPPLVSQASLGGFGNGNTFPGTYDFLGRQLFVNLTADF